MMQRTISLWCLPALLFAVVAASGLSTPEPNVTSADAVLQQIRQREQAADFRAVGRLVQVAADGHRTNYKIGIKGHWFPDGMELLYEVNAPDAARVRVLLHRSADGMMSVETMKARDTVATKIASAHWRDSFLGTAFSYEDLAEEEYFWHAQQVTGTAKYGARDCFVLKSRPAATDHSQYESVTSYIDQKIFYPVQVEKHAGSGDKTFSYQGLRQTDGVWSASQIEVKTPGQAGTTLLVIERGSAKARLSRKDFVLTPVSSKETAEGAAGGKTE